jgi:uncharacterized protein YndB with AHSA1/START domain
VFFTTQWRITMSMFQRVVTFSARPDKVYNALMQSGQHSEFTGAPAEIGTHAGAGFSAHGGHINGIVLDLVEGQRIVKAWRAANWDAGVFSLVHISLASAPEGCVLTLVHSACPEGTAEHLDAGWHKMYWVPLTAYLAG